MLACKFEPSSSDLVVRATEIEPLVLCVLTAKTWVFPVSLLPKREQRKDDYNVRNCPDCYERNC